MSIILIPVDAASTASASAVSNDTVGSDLIAIQVFPDTLKMPSIQESVTGNNETMNMFLLTTKPSDIETNSESHLESLIQSAPASKAEDESLVTPQNIQKPFRCKYCEKTFVFRRTLKMHKKTHFLQKSAPSNKNEFSETSDDDDNDNCITDEEGMEYTSLDVCADLNPSGSSNIKTLEKPFECEKCGERFLLKPSLKLHNDIHLYESSAVNINYVDARIDEEDVNVDGCTDLGSSNIQTLEKPFECKKCGERFLLKTSLKKHNDIHIHDADNYMDTECLDEDDTKIAEKVMGDTNTDACGNSSPCIPSNILLEKPFVCQQCGERFVLKTSLKKHRKIHVLENIETFASSNYAKNSAYILCSENSDNDNNKIGEKAVVDPSLDACADLIPCIPPSIQLNEHIECEKSGEKFSSKTSLNKLDKINLSESYHSTVSINDIDNNVYIFCSENSENDNNKAEEKAVEVTILDPCPNSSQYTPCNMQGLEKPFKCKKCDERFLLKTSLKKHNKIHSYNSHYSSIKTNDTENSVDSEEIYGCDKCGKVFVGENSYEAHLKKHTEKSNECNICQRKFKSVAVLQNHMHLHTKGMIHVCGICKKSFFSQSILEAHVTKHRAVKLYICEICKKSFSDKTTLTMHVRIHIEEKSYKCPICNLMCFSLSSLKQHVMTH